MESNIVFVVTKSKYWKPITNKFNLEHPDLRTKLTSDLKKRAIDFANGYTECLKEMVEKPYNVGEVEEHILTVMVDFIIKNM